MNLEIPKKFKPVKEAALMAAKSVFRPISRKYDTLEHDYPKELDLFAAALDGMNDAGSSIGGATGSRGETVDKNVVRNGGNMASVINIMTMCYGDVGLLLAIPRQGLGNAAISAVANDEQLQRFGKLWAAMAITEPGAGSDSAAITTTAVKDGDEYILNGEKIFVTAGERADAIVVWASLDKNLGRAAIKSFVVEKGTPGMELVRLETKMGIRASDTAAISFVNCRVPAANLLGSPEIDVKNGFAGVMETFDNTRPFVAAMAVGCAEAALERTKELLQNQINLNYTSPINNLNAVEAEILKLEADYEAARLLTIKAAWMADNKIPNSMEASICKAKAGRIGNKITLKCVELCSSIGYSEGELLEKWARDSKILDIFEGTQQIQQLIIARRLLGKSSKDLK
ncbi:MAG TPA: acyl-CoA dehydrogenase family protein [Chitinophagales bacterium]|jgi:acyl-CoA dehydrogenase|nr:acyl-CoA dehydrogenase family protein [Chitinophagales bacterium]MBP6153278.1 acyl-CoA dehydrogenase family protein [Chitinophagales bacterium]HQV78462.1 acyl-CoA dehydrogenase family protein [Chitinophagales bacterium]HQW78852.1 acyl-CoA dehydrogenase family protein [Chitinophagales bacterium]HRB18963.1 acyl-CoA dehydrogenase family protein [Chitinophagales bacterium]